MFIGAAGFAICELAIAPVHSVRLDLVAALRVRNLLHVVHGEHERDGSSSTRPTTCAAGSSSLYYYAWNGLAPLGGLIIGWLSRRAAPSSPSRSPAPPGSRWRPAAPSRCAVPGRWCRLPRSRPSPARNSSPPDFRSTGAAVRSDARAPDPRRRDGRCSPSSPESRAPHSCAGHRKRTRSPARRSPTRSRPSPETIGVSTAWDDKRDVVNCGQGQDALNADLADTWRNCETVSVRLSRDRTTAFDAQHETQVEPDSFSVGSTIVTAFQTGRVDGGGAAAIGWATSTDAGKHWRGGTLLAIAVRAGQRSRRRL